MRCICGLKLPDDATRYPITPQDVKFRVKGKEVKSYETHIVKCHGNHSPGTAWNYVHQAEERDKEDARRR